MSETGSNFGMPTHDLDLLRRKAGSCGLPFMTMETRIADEEGTSCPPGRWVSCGYADRASPTGTGISPIPPRAFRDGWFITGDVAMQDADGFFYIVDRKRTCISGGENVYPAEVEAVLAGTGRIAECAVIGVPDDRWEKSPRLRRDRRRTALSAQE
jgi:fatty-acyl-CoA synthase